MNLINKDRERLFEKIFLEGPLGIALVGLDFRFLEVNHALSEMTGYSADELKQLRFTDITYPDDLSIDVQLAQQVFLGARKNYKIEKRYVKKSGEIIWISLTASVIRDENDTPLYGLAMIADITEFKTRDTPPKTSGAIQSEASGELLCVCSWCNRMRTGSGQWQHVAEFIHRMFDLKTTHTICEQCLTKQKS